MKPALEAIAEATDNAPPIGKMSKGNGYYSGSNLQALDDANIDAYVATDRREKPAAERLEDSDRKFVKADFIYHETDDHFTCPAGEKLIYNTASKAKTKSYRVSKAICQGCPLRKRCSGNNKTPGKIIRTDRHEAIRQAMNRKMETKEAKLVYERRKVIAEPPFGQIKNSGFKGFSVRGKKSSLQDTHKLKKRIELLFCSIYGCPSFSLIYGCPSFSSRVSQRKSR